jgi:hypothetical protein
MNYIPLIAGTLLTAVLLNLITLGIIRWMRSAKSDRDALQDSLAKIAAGLSRYAESAGAAAGPLDKILEIQAEHVVQVGLLRAEIKKLSETMFRKSELRPYEAHTEHEKDYAWRARELASREQIPFTEALKKIMDEEIQSTVSPGVFDLG